MTETEEGQFSPASGERLRLAAAGLASALQQHAAGVATMRGGTSERAALDDLNDLVTAAAIAWTGAAYAHTGTFVLPLEVEEDDLSYEDDDDDDEPVVQSRLSLLSRWDMNVTDPAGLVVAGRAAHRRVRPRENEEDALAAIADGDAAQALYAILDEAGEPVLRIEGLQVVRGARLYIEPEDAWDDEEDVDFDPGLLPSTVEPPAGPIVFSELW